MRQPTFQTNDFSGGIVEAVSAPAFGERSHARLHGFVIESDRTARSQWPLQQISSASNLRTFATLKASKEWLVAIFNDGTLRFAQQPTIGSSAATCAAVSWTTLASGLSSADKLTGLTVVKLSDGTFRTGLIVNRATGSDAARIIHENSGGTALVTFTHSDRYPDLEEDDDGAMVPTEGVLPRANVMSMWGDHLILGDVEGAANPEQKFSASNRKRYSNALWISRPGVEIDRFHPERSFLVPFNPEAVVLGMHEVDAGLLVVSTDASDRDGLILLRGTPDDYRVERLRGGLGVYEQWRSWHDQRPTCLWSEVGSVVYPDRLGRLWHSDGREVARLDEYGILEPKRGTDQKVRVAAGGAYLLAYTGGRLLAGRLLSDMIAWTTLEFPQIATHGIVGMTGDEDAVHVLRGDGTLWRYVVADRGPANERGRINGAVGTFEWGSATQADVEQHRSLGWRAVGLRASSPQGSGQLLDVTVRDRGVLSSGAISHTTAVAEPVGQRGEWVVPAHGPSAECAVVSRWQGDVVLEGCEWFVVTRRGRVY